jgi:hypothetical protein
MPELGRTKPCAECPWLKCSARGYLGADDPEHFYRVSVPQESEMPCHMEIDYEDPDWQETQLPTVDLCAGNLIYLRNHMKKPRKRHLADAWEKVEKSPHVFSWAIEFFQHHLPFATSEEICETAKKAAWPYSDSD